MASSTFLSVETRQVVTEEGRDRQWARRRLGETTNSSRCRAGVVAHRRAFRRSRRLEGAGVGETDALVAHDADADALRPADDSCATSPRTPDLVSRECHDDRLDLLTVRAQPAMPIPDLEEALELDRHAAVPPIVIASPVASARRGQRGRLGVLAQVPGAHRSRADGVDQREHLGPLPMRLPSRAVGDLASSIKYASSCRHEVAVAC